MVCCGVKYTRTQVQRYNLVLIADTAEIDVISFKLILKSKDQRKPGTVSESRPKDSGPYCYSMVSQEQSLELRLTCEQL